MTLPVAENSPAAASVAEPASPIHAARTAIDILRTEADPIGGERKLNYSRSHPTALCVSVGKLEVGAPKKSPETEQRCRAGYFGRFPGRECTRGQLFPFFG